VVPAPTPDRFHLYGRPDSRPLTLAVEPQLASWNHKGDRDQLRIAAFLDHLRDVGANDLRDVAGPLSLSLEIGLPAAKDLLHQRDLDNYLQRVGEAYAGHDLVAAWASKRHASRSTFALGAAAQVPHHALESGWSFAGARPAGSYERPAWRRQVAEQISSQAISAPEGPVELHVAFRVDSTVRVWTNLWKYAIDALVPVLGAETRSHRLEPRDGRVTTLGLHRVDALGSGFAIELGYWWRPEFEAT
jgi:hypothetical protein